MVFGAGKASVQASKQEFSDLNFTGYTIRENGQAASFTDITDNGVDTFVAVGGLNLGDAAIFTSPDGTTWTERANPSTGAAIFSVTFGNSTFVCVGNDDGANGLIMTSPDGITWTKRTSNDAIYDRVVWEPVTALFYAVGRDQGGSEAQLTTSPDGITWTQRTIPGVNLMDRGWDVYRSNGATPMICIGSDTGVGTDPKYIASANGTSWTVGPNFLTLGSNDFPYAALFDSVNDKHFVVYNDGFARFNNNSGLPGTVDTDYGYDPGVFQLRTRIIQPIAGGGVTFAGSGPVVVWVNAPFTTENTLGVGADFGLINNIHYGFNDKFYICGINGAFTIGLIAELTGGYT